jgi:hypothetical protein
MKKFTIILLVLIIVGVGVYYFMHKSSPVVPVTESQNNTVATTTPIVKQSEGDMVVIGKSVEGRDIIAYNYGQGDKKILFVGGIHGGYSYNTSLVAYELMDYLKTNPGVVPSNVKVTVIPVLNPDGLNKVVGTSSRFALKDVSSSQTVQVSGRFNANKVDLSRNFDCGWKSVGTWKNNPVSGGSKVFSEPESVAIKGYIESHTPTAVVIWYSAAGGVYSSSCDGGVSAETKAITDIYAKASGYPAYDSFDLYETSGDMANWLAKINVPTISVLLTNHKDTEWNKNQKGIDALLSHFAK